MCIHRPLSVKYILSFYHWANKSHLCILNCLPPANLIQDWSESDFQMLSYTDNLVSSMLLSSFYNAVTQCCLLSQATEQLMSDILRQALAVAYQTAPHNRYSTRTTYASTKGWSTWGVQYFCGVQTMWARGFQTIWGSVCAWTTGVCHVLAP